ncbi:BamA/TamA family outer membrane protein [Iodobacter sp. HSC-16F04]|uniref:BamA/TamA family outer membrane protein n=1 Tax=Iodobacter violaceini TaxID=3044271 RepID=A0ABX0KVE2_9NEIS|nr:patatin-like phospholipase family protein [Iodobacter violacea]NHQ87759.1 BamA/TamA family outer membrane protein [Iodobacter violacea]
MLRARSFLSKSAFIIVLGFSCVSLQAFSAERPRIGLVLGGGGARGLAHIGVLKVLEEARVPVDCVVGTSIGSLVGGAYAAGRTPEELASRAVEANWDDLLSSSLPRQLSAVRKKQDDKLNLVGIELGMRDSGEVALPSAAISTQKIALFLREMTFGGTIASFDSLSIPYRAVATDIETGEMVVLKDGDIVTAMRASMAVPGLFPAVARDSRLLVDGGLARNVPVDVARSMCADVIIAVDVGAQPLNRDQINSILSTADQYTRLMVAQNVKPQLESLKPTDVLITPNLGTLSSADFKKGQEFIAKGEEAATLSLYQLSKYSLSEADYAAWKKNKLAHKLQPQPVQMVDVVPMRNVNPDVLKEALDVQIGQKLNSDDFHKRLAEVYARGDFSQLDYELTDHDGAQQLTLVPREKDWGPNYLSFGMGMGTDFEGNNPYALTAMYKRTWINSLGAEWKSSLRVGDTMAFQTEFYQPLQLDGYAFIAPSFSYKSSPVSIWQGGENLAQYRYAQSRFGLDLGSSLTRFGEVRLGVSYQHFDAAKQIGAAIASDSTDGDYGVNLKVYYDQLDHLYFPGKGDLVNINAYYALKGQGDFSKYGRIGIEAEHAFNFNGVKGNLAVQGSYSYKDAPFLPDFQSLGGFLNLSSYRKNELLGENSIYAKAQLYSPVSLLGLSVGGSYLGAAIETGRMFNVLDETQEGWHTSVTGFWAADTYLGPFYLGAAYGDNKKLRYYLMLGNQF